MADRTDVEHMAHALRLAARGLYTCDPNPRVGCVIAHGERVVGTGFHAVAGEAHAEVEALRAAGEHARGATVYVTLEPCCHHGRTPPCTDALIEARVGRVVYALRDPDPRVSGQGADALAAAGIAVERLDASAPGVREQNIGFVKRLAAGRPWIRVKLAASLDGGTALASGESQWITGEDARRDVHRWRARSSCVLTGSGTVLADDPGLDVRLTPAELGIDRPARQPAVVVLDTALRTPPTARLFSRHDRVLVCGGTDRGPRADALRSAGAEVIALPTAEAPGEPGTERLALGPVFAALAERGVNEVHVEAGSTLCGRLLSDGYVDELMFYMAPVLLGAGTRGLFQVGPLASMQDRIPLHILDTRQVGADLRIRALPILDRRAGHERGSR